MEIKKLDEMIARLERESARIAEQDQENAKWRSEAAAQEIREIKRALHDLPGTLTGALLDASAYVFASELIVESETWADQHQHPNLKAIVESCNRRAALTGSPLYRHDQDMTRVEPGKYRVVLCLVPIPGPASAKDE